MVSSRKNLTVPHLLQHSWALSSEEQETLQGSLQGHFCIEESYL